MPQLSNINWIISVIKDLCDVKFFGEITIKFNGGKVIHVDKHVSLLPPKEV